MADLTLDIEQFPAEGFTVLSLNLDYLPIGAAVVKDIDGPISIPFLSSSAEALLLAAQLQLANPSQKYVPFPADFESLRSCIKAYWDPARLDKISMENDIAIEEASKVLPVSIVLLDDPEKPIYHYVI